MLRLAVLKQHRQPKKVLLYLLAKNEGDATPPLQKGWRSNFFIVHGVTGAAPHDIIGTRDWGRCRGSRLDLMVEERLLLALSQRISQKFRDTAQDWRSTPRSVLAATKCETTGPKSIRISRKDFFLFSDIITSIRRCSRIERAAQLHQVSKSPPATPSRHGTSCRHPEGVPHPPTSVL